MLKIINLISASLLLTAPAMSHASMMYSVVDLGSLDPDSNISATTNINNNGNLVGYSYQNWTQTSFQYSEHSGMQAFDDIGGTISAINDSGSVAGLGNEGFVVDKNGQRQTLNPLSGGMINQINDMNNTSTVVGSSLNGSFMPRATRWDGSTGEATDLGSLNDDTTNPNTSSQANAINENGQIVGYSSSGNSQTATLWENGEIQDLGSLEGDYSSTANAINDAGTIVGNSGTSAVLWNNGSIFEIDGSGFSTANDINNNGQVVGGILADSGMFGYLWNIDDGFSLLNDLLLDADGWSINDVVAINDNDWIAANATYSANGQYFSHGVLLKPTSTSVSEPASFGLFMLCMLTAFRKRIFFRSHHKVAGV